jgi:hypothetical protein
MILAALLLAAAPAAWVPAHWEGGPLEVARRAAGKAPLDPAVKDAIAGWYDPATLDLLVGSPVNCLLVTFTAGAAADVEERQHQLVAGYVRRAHERSIAVLGSVHPGADAAATAAAASDAGLDGLVLEGEFPGGLSFAERLVEALRAARSTAIVIPVASSQALRQSAWPVIAVEGVPPGVGKSGDTQVASPSGGLWIDSNLWLARSFRPTPGRPVWISHRPDSTTPGMEARAIADAASAGARWIVALPDGLRPGLLRRDTQAMAAWRAIHADLAFFESHSEWRSYTPHGTVGLVFDPRGKDLSQSEEYLNLVARKRIPYRVIHRASLGPQSLENLRAVLAFDLAPATAAERAALRAFAAKGGLVLTGPSWGGAPKGQTYTIQAEGEGEVAVYKEDSPDPQTVARDISDLVSTSDLGMSFFKAPSVLPVVSASSGGAELLIQFVNYATEPSEPMTVWLTGDYDKATFLTPAAPAAPLSLKRTGERTELTVPPFPSNAAILLHKQ